MRMRTLQISLIVICSILDFSLHAQTNAYNTGINGSIVDLPCQENCVKETFRIPHLKGPSDYSVYSIPYQPFSYAAAGGTELTSIYEDDLYSEEIPLPFPFCFYDTVFTSMVVGSNGLVTFDPANALCANAYVILDAIPNNTGQSCTTTEEYYPKASIMGLYSDLDPSPTSSQADRRIEWRVEGTAPARRFIVSFYHIGAYNSCGASSTNTFQIVLYESSGIIDIFVEQKGCPTGSSGGSAVMGLQNWYRDKAVSPPGKNNAVWTESNSAYRFVPSGNTSRFVSCEALAFDGTRIALADTTTTVAGLLDVSFTNFCVSGNTGQYIIKSVYSGCDDPTDVVTMDTITINRTNKLNPTINTSQTGCGLTGTGTATILIPQGSGTSPYTFVLNPGNKVQTSFSGNTLYTGLTANNYTVDISDAASSCVTQVNFTITSTGVLPISFTSVNTSCEGASNGSITIDPPIGTPPLTYSINNSPFTSSNVFSNLAPGDYLINVQDGGGCKAVDVPVKVDAGDPIGITTISLNTSCPGINDGGITVTSSSGTPAFNYAINGGTFQTNQTFSGLAPAIYFITVRDAIGCIATTPVAVGQGATTISGTLTATPATCLGVNNGSITVTPTGGTGTFDYSITNGTSWQTSNIFGGLAPGSYSIYVRENGGCRSNPINAIVLPGITLTGTAAPTNITCNGASNGIITITPDNGVLPYQYTLNGGPAQTSNIFNGVAPGIHQFVIRDNAGCVSAPVSVTITEPAVLSAPVPAVKAVSCNGLSDGTITVAPSGGTAPYEYSLNNVSFQASNTFNVSQGTYTLYVRDKNNCRIQFANIIVTQPAPLTGTILSTTNATCNGGNDGTIEVSAIGGNSTYTYSADGTNFQSSNQLKVKSGIYRVTIRDGSSCSFEIPNVSVGLTDDLVLTAANPAPICEGTGVQLQVNSNAIKYNWTSAAAGLSNTMVASPVASPLVTTTYNVTAILGVCSRTATVTVTVLPAPKANAGADGEICYGRNYRLSGLGGLTYSWSPALYLDNASLASPTATNPLQTTTYSLTVTDANNCQSLIPDQVIVHVVPPIKVTITPADTVVYAGAQFQLQASSAGINYTWSPATGLSNTSIANPVVTASTAIGAETIYRVTTTTAAGCEGEGFARVKVYEGPEIYVANAFTPNRDGKNDFFIPFAVGIKQLNFFRVFNRWGQMIYSTTTLQKGWDGQWAGKEQASGVYIWSLQGVTEKGAIINKQGTVMLIR